MVQGTILDTIPYFMCNGLYYLQGSSNQAISDNVCLTENIPSFLSQGICEEKRNYNISSPDILILSAFTITNHYFQCSCSKLIVSSRIN